MLKNRMVFTWLQVFFYWLVLVVFMGSAASAEGPEVVYDKATDRLSVGADSVSLKGLLARIAFLSGVEFLIDPEVEQPVSITFKDCSLEGGLKKIMQALDLRYAMVYEKKKGQDPAAEPLLISMKIVPEGKQNNPNLLLAPVVDANGEAVVRSLSSFKAPRGGDRTPAAIFDHARERWQARLDNMPEEKRERIEAQMQQRQAKRAARMEKKKIRKAKREERRAEHQARRIAAEEKLRVSNPELYELRRQQREELRQQKLEELSSQ